MPLVKIVNPDLVTATTLDTEYVFKRTVRQDQEVLIEVQTGSARFAVGENSNNSNKIYTAGENMVLTIGPKTIDHLHASANSLTATFSIGF